MFCAEGLARRREISEGTKRKSLTTRLLLDKEEEALLLEDLLWFCVEDQATEEFKRTPDPKQESRAVPTSQAGGKKRQGPLRGF